MPKVVSDTHFSHERIIKLCKRPFSTVDEMDAALIKAWNGVVNPTEDVWFLGDFSWADPQRTREIFHALNGRKHLIIGNHDKNSMQLPWETKRQHHILNYKKKRFVLCHFPMREWQGFYSGAFHLYGHTHGSIPNKNRSMDVGVDSSDGYKPYDLDDIINMLEGETNEHTDLIKRMGFETDTVHAGRDAGRG